MQSIYTAASGLKNMQARLDTIAANISNVNTTGYKAKRLDFKDALYKALEVPKDPILEAAKAAEAEAARAAAGEAAAGDNTAADTETGAADTQTAETGTDTAAADTAADNEKEYVLIGSGVIISSTTSDFSDGPAQLTGVSTDLTISGRGFFTLLNPSGETIYTRNGNFNVSSEGYLVNANGYFVLDNSGGRIRIEGDANKFGVTADGTMKMPDGVLGRLGLADFNNPNGLEAVGDTCYRATPESGQALGADTASVQQGTLENSNVELADDMTMLVRSQRAFSLVSKALQTADDMEGLANTIHR